MADGFEAGRAYVRISPDTDGFADDLRSEVKAATSRVDGRVTITADTDDLMAAIASARAQIDQIEGRSAMASLDVDDGDLAAKTAAAEAKLRGVGAETARPRLALDDSGFEIAADDAETRMAFLGSMFARPRLTLDDAGLAAKAAADRQKLDALKASMIGLAVPVFGSLVPALGGTAAGLGAIAGVGALAFMPIESAIANSAGNAQELNAALAKMPPSARNFTSELMKAKSSLTGLESLAQNAVLPGAGVLLQGVMSMMPQVKSAVSQMGQVLGSGLASIGKTLQTSGAKDVLSGLVANGAQLMKTVGPGLGQLAGALAKIGAQKGAVAGIGSALSGIAGGLTGLVKGLGPALGPLGSVLSTVGAAVGALGPPLAQIADALASALAPALRSVLPAFRTLAAALGSSLSTAIRGLSPLLQLAGQGLAQIVTAAEPLLPVLSGVIGQLGTALAGALRPVIAALVPDLKIMVSVLGQDLATGVRLVSPLLGVLSGVLTSVLTAVRPVLPVVGQVAQQLGQALAPVVRALTPTLQIMGQVVGVVLKAGLSALSSVLIALLPPVGQLVTAIAPLLTITARLTSAIVGLAAKAITPVAALLGDVLGAAVRAVAGEISVSFHAIGDVAGWLYRNGIKPQMDALKAVFGAVGDAAGWLYSTQVAPAFHAIGTVAEWLYDNGIRPQAEAIETLFRGVASTGTWLWQDGIEPAFRGIGTAAQWLYNTGIRPQVQLIETLFRGMQSAASAVWSGMLSGVRGFVSAFSSAWSRLEAVFRTPVNYLIGTVYGQGIRLLWDSVVGAVGMKSLDLPPVSKLAAGGVLPGYAPGVDSVPAMLSPGEAVLTPGAARAVGHENIDALNAAHRPGRAAPAPRDGIARYAGGTGLVSQAEGALGSVASAVGGAVKGAVSDVAGAASIASALLSGNTTALSGALDKAIGTSAGGDLGKIMTGIPKTLTGDLVKAVSSLGSSPVSTAPVNVPGNVRTWIAEGMKIAGVSGPAWSNGLLTMAMHESGGNPSIINHWDSNAKAGTPSGGLLQFIEPTFRQYAMPGHTQWLNPVDQVIADAWPRGYIRSRYGDISRVPGVASIASGGGYVGYDQGGYLPPGVTSVVNASGTPEPVFTGSQWATLEKLVNSVTANGTGAAAPVVNQNYYGSTMPTAEQAAEMKRQLALTLGGA